MSSLWFLIRSVKRLQQCPSLQTRALTELRSTSGKETGELWIFTVKRVLQWNIWVSSDLTACAAIVTVPLGGSDWAFLVPAPVFGPTADDIYQRDDTRTQVSSTEGKKNRNKNGVVLKEPWKQIVLRSYWKPSPLPSSCFLHGNESFFLL